MIVEVCQLLLSRRGTRSEALFLSSIAAGELRVADPVPADYARTTTLVQRYADLPLGAVDALVVSMAERFGATHIATLDRRHFGIVRPRHVESFTLLPE